MKINTLKLKELAKTAVRGIMILLVGIMLGVTARCVQHTVNYRNRGFDLIDSCGLAVVDTMDEINYILEPILPEPRENKYTIMEYPIANWNISWNTLAKPEGAR